MSRCLRIARSSFLILVLVLATWMPASTADARCRDAMVPYVAIAGDTCYSVVCYLTGEGIGPFTGGSYCFYDDCEVLSGNCFWT